MHCDDLKRSLCIPGGMTCRTFIETVADYLEGTYHFYDRLGLHMNLGICLGYRCCLPQMKQTVRTLGDHNFSNLTLLHAIHYSAAI